MNQHSTADARAERPNILWICTDQQRFDTLGCYGNPFVRTPHIDALAKQGVLFERAFCQSPVCTPSRGSFLTGRYPRTARCRQNGAAIPGDEILVTKLRKITLREGENKLLLKCIHRSQEAYYSIIFATGSMMHEHVTDLGSYAPDLIVIEDCRRSGSEISGA